MISTPAKSKDSSLNNSLTPVRFIDSPIAKINFNDPNVATCKSRLEVVIRTTEDNFDKWLLAEKRGQSLCSSIEAIKTKALEKLASNENSDYTSYPNELKMYCDKLAVVYSIFEDITKSTRESLKQLKALSKLSGISNEIFHRSWQLKEFIAFITEVLTKYENEALIKRHVMENLPHCTSRSDLIRCSTAWEYPQYVESYVNLLFLIFKEEIK